MPPTSTSNGHGSITPAAASEAIARSVATRLASIWPKNSIVVEMDGGRLPVGGEEGFAPLHRRPSRYQPAVLVDTQGHLRRSLRAGARRDGWLLSEDGA